jgi:hypothetical protein
VDDFYVRVVCDDGLFAHPAPARVRVTTLGGHVRLMCDNAICLGLARHMTRSEWVDYYGGMDQVRVPA